MIWENFDKEKILQDFYDRVENYVSVRAESSNGHNVHRQHTGHLRNRHDIGCR